MKKLKRAALMVLAVILVAVAVPIVISAATSECTVNGVGKTFAAALTDAASATGDVTIELNKSITVSTDSHDRDIKSGGGKITINGNGHTVSFTNNGRNHAFCVYANTELNNLNIVSNNHGSALQILSAVTVDLNNVIIDASAKVYRKFTVINTLGSVAGETINLTLTNSKILMGADLSTSGSELSAIRTGNGVDGDTVNVTLLNSELDVTGTATGVGIHVTGGTIANISLTNSKVRAHLGYAIIANNQKVTVVGGQLISGFGDNAKSCVSGNSNTTITPDAATPDIYIYGAQETAASGGKFKTRFISAIKTADLPKYENIKMAITVANATAVLSNNAYNIIETYETLSNGTVSKAGYSFGTAIAEELPTDKELIITVELYAKEKGGAEKLVDSETFSYGTNGAYANSKYDAFDYAINRNDLTGRYLLVSDIHYVGSGGRSNSTNHRYEYFGLTSDARMQLLCDAIEQEYKLRGLDGIIVLGDLSTDDWYSGCPTSWLPSNTYYAKKLYTDYLKPLADDLGIDLVLQPGNHDSYPNSKWVEFFGADRETVYVDGDNVFIMLDTYDDTNGADKDRNNANGSDYTGINMTWLEQQLEAYKASNYNVYICAHYFNRKTTATNSAVKEDLDAIKTLLAKYPNVVTLFEGHTHDYANSTVYAGQTIINTGNFAYGSWDETSFHTGCKDCGRDDPSCVWGFQIVETSADNAVTYRVNVAHNYTYQGGENWNQPYEKLGDIILK